MGESGRPATTTVFGPGPDGRAVPPHAPVAAWRTSSAPGSTPPCSTTAPGTWTTPLATVGDPTMTALLAAALAGGARRRGSSWSWSGVTADDGAARPRRSERRRSARAVPVGAPPGAGALWRPAIALAVAAAVGLVAWL